MRARADRAAQFSDGDNFAGAFEPFQRAAKFVKHQSQFQTKRRRLGVDSVAASDARRELKFLRAARDDFPQCLHVRDQYVRRLDHLHGVAGVAHVAARQAKMKPAAGVIADFFGDGGGETDDVVVEDFFQFALAGDEAGQISEPFVAAGLDFFEIFSFTSASLASNSICSQMRSLFSSVQMARISRRE
jgi:hypothetical protein